MSVATLHSDPHPGFLLPEISCAFQPIVDMRTRTVTAYEALVRGNHGESAAQIIASVPSSLLTAFDQHCRAVAIQTAARLGLSCDLHLNLMPQSVQLHTDCLASMSQTAQESGVPIESLVIEVTEQELLGDESHFIQLAELYRSVGLRISLDDFGAGYSGLNLLAEFQPDALKLDKFLVRGIPHLGPRQAIVRALLQVCRDLGIDLIAEGIESRDEFSWFCDEGVYLFQGYYFGRPTFESLAPAHFP